MDTKFWGPSGWKFLHTLTLTYEPHQKVAMSDFLETLPYILPCKFCRASLTDYYRKLPYKDALKSRASLVRWLWKIHSMVNDKLRGQGQTIPPDPSLAQVKEIYGRFVPESKPNLCEAFPGWDFLFSVAYNHPLTSHGKPMPDAPVLGPGTSDEELNKWNLLPPRRRYCKWTRFWALMPKVMPAAWSYAWMGAKEVPCLQSKKTTVAWLWRLRCKFADGADPYKVVCHKLATHESGCSKFLRAKTCRKSNSSRKTKRLSKRY